MRVILQAKSGPSVGRMLLLRDGQAIQIGRTERAEFVVPDNLMSGLHFALEADFVACCVTDLGSRNGTYVNGRRIMQKIRLRDGDEIRAGATIFAIRIEGARPVGADTAARLPMSSAELEKTPVGPAGGPAAAAHYSVEQCDSGLTLCRGETAELSPGALAVQLNQLYPVHLLVDFNKLRLPPPAELTVPAYLFDWLGPVVAASISPMVIAHREWADWPSLFDTGWGADAVVCLFTKQDKPALLDHLRRMCRANVHPRASGAVSLLGYCWPSVMAPLLLSFRPEFVEQLLTGISAVLVEFPDLPDTWQLYGRKAELLGALDQLGLIRQASEATDTQPCGHNH